MAQLFLSSDALQPLPPVVNVSRPYCSWFSTLTFEPPDTDTFRCLALAYQAARLGDTYPAVLNAANEVAVGAFLDGRLAYLGIPDVVERVLDAHEPIAPSLEGVLEVDAWARGQASATIATRGPSRPRIIPGSGATR